MLQIGALWVGGKLPPYCAACLVSFVTHNHPVTLYSYEPIDGMPSGISTEPANAILPKRIYDAFARTRKYSQFSNYFRYRLLAARPGICWVDTDVYCLRPIEAENHIFGWEDAAFINTAVLALPSDSQVLANLLNMFESITFVPEWLGRRGALFRTAAAIGFPVPRERYPWGSLGPRALTHYVKSAALGKFAKPVRHFYPLHWRDAGRLLEPGCDENSDLLRDAHTIHLWNEVLRKRPDAADPPVGSLLWKIINGKGL